jgi:hypothetical protein
VSHPALFDLGADYEELPLSKVMERAAEWLREMTLEDERYHARHAAPNQVS